MNVRQLSLFASFTTLDFVLSWVPLASIIVGYLMLPMFRIMLGWRLTFYWFLLGFITSIPSLIRQSSVFASTQEAVITNPIHFNLWIPYFSPFIGWLQYEGGQIPLWLKGPAALIFVVVFCKWQWSTQLKLAKSILILIPQLRSWGYFSQEDFDDHWRIKRREARRMQRRKDKRLYIGFRKMFR